MLTNIDKALDRSHPGYRFEDKKHTHNHRLLEFTATLRTVVNNKKMPSENDIQLVIESVNAFPDNYSTTFKNNVHYFLANFMKIEYGIAIPELLKTITLDSPQFFAEASQDIAEYYFTNEKDDFKQHLLNLIEAFGYSLKVYFTTHATHYFNFCINVACTDWAAQAENIGKAQVFHSRYDTPTKVLQKILKESSLDSIEAIMEWVVAQLELQRREETIKKQRHAIQELTDKISEYTEGTEKPGHISYPSIYWEVRHSKNQEIPLTTHQSTTPRKAKLPIAVPKTEDQSYFSRSFFSSLGDAYTIHKISLLLKTQSNSLLKELYDISQLSHVEFEALDFNRAIEDPDDSTYGISLLWALCQFSYLSSRYAILDLPDKYFCALNFNAGPKSAKFLDQGMTVLYLLCQNTILDKKHELLQRISDLPYQYFQTLNFNAGPKKKPTVLWWACQLALHKQLYFLEKIMSLAPQYIYTLNFNAASESLDHPASGQTVFWLACELALKREIALLQLIFSLPKEKIEDLLFYNLITGNAYFPKIIEAITFLLSHEKECSSVLSFLCHVPDGIFKELSAESNAGMSAQYKSMIELAFKIRMAIKNKSAIIDETEEANIEHIIEIIRATQNIYTYAFTQNADILLGNAIKRKYEDLAKKHFAKMNQANTPAERLSNLLKIMDYEIKAYCMGRSSDSLDLCIKIISAYWSTIETSSVKSHNFFAA